MKVTIKTFFPVVVLVLLTIGIYVTGIGSQLQSAAFKTLPQSIITRFFNVNFSLSSGDETISNLSTTSLLELDHADSENIDDRLIVPSNNPASNIHNSKNVSIKTASVTLSSSVTPTARNIYFSNKLLNYSFAGSTFGTTPSNIIARSTSPVIKTSAPSTPTRVTTTRAPTTTNNPNETFYITAANMRVGRLGNQMFRYASLLGIARSNGRELIIAPGSQLQGVFKLTHVRYIQESSGWPLKRNSGLDLGLMNLPKKNLRIGGYLQSPRYFSSVGDEVRQEFLFHDSVAFAAAKIVHSILPKHTGSLLVGVHARRGDFLRIQKGGYAVPEKSYFVKAFQWMRSKFPGRNLTFLVASDDLGWVRANLEAKDVVVVPPASPGVHMAVLSSCEHMVISGGTFGWWSGWMAGGYVVYFTGFMAKGTTLGKYFVPSDYYPPLWVGFEN